MYYIENRSSTCVDALAVDPLTKVVVVRYHNGREYTYKNVSRRSIANVTLNPSVSLGFWINKVKRDKKVSCKETGFNVLSNALLAS
tara:strand:- start:1248 stop:1505 length:258 start_codon:yes stop_codon:yes gene_type:complete